MLTFQKFSLLRGMTSTGFGSCLPYLGHQPLCDALPKRLAPRGHGFPISVASHTGIDHDNGSHAYIRT